ncbi:alpha/beta fold hydrolase [Mycobacterium sp. CVI_P3]|uniref:Alpha/beta fold hydrolase n=1 Tax=Mycobacterium pinniadriaticum TaxID=2994102 RepID=A0ABT3SHT0_9MYCO|nr:alpha/beta fold hydrolase [Mycobacterium pinniadriaticum]MCX2932217.1 alpha/beta fold hydrolase [Mycobacterium pinniadriaticum]MCX2938683.1 alpha/beta fold hydrolase [Mycobacterium pinniadriaticum]
MSTFALIHGAWHGPWCWERLAPELERRGHRAVAVDVRFDDPTATFEDHAATFAAALDENDQDVVAVGHSLGSYALPWIADRCPLRRQVYLCGVVAEPGRTFAELNREQHILNPAYPAGLVKVDGGTRWVDLDLARSLFYSDCDDDVVEAAIPRLRMQAGKPMTQRCTFDRLPSVPATYIACADDRMIDPAWSRRVATERLGAELVELPGGHSPFYSRPAVLADALHRLV